MKLSLLAYSIEEKNEGEMKRPVQREECRVESRPPARGIEKKSDTALTGLETSEKKSEFSFVQSSSRTDLLIAGQSDV